MQSVSDDDVRKKTSLKVTSS